MAMQMMTAQINKLLMKRIKAKAVELDVTYTQYIEALLERGVKADVTQAEVLKCRRDLIQEYLTVSCNGLYPFDVTKKDLNAVQGYKSRKLMAID